MNKNLLFFFLLLWCGAARGQEYNDRIIMHNGVIIKCDVVKIDKNYVYYQKHGQDGFKKIDEIKELYISDKSPRIVSQSSIIEIYNARKHILDSLANINSIDSVPLVSTPAQLISYDPPHRKHDSAGFYSHTLKLNLLSVIFTEATIKYEYRFKNKLGFQAELGYIHDFPTLELPFYPFNLPFSYKGIVARAGIRKYFEPVRFKRNRYLSLSILYKNQYHEKMIVYKCIECEPGYELWAKRNVYGAQINIGNEKYAGHFLFEYYIGISLRYINEKQIIYRKVFDVGSPIYYTPPKHETHEYVRPGFHIGINLGWGFNGMKKKKE